MNRSVSAQISYDRLNKGVDVRNASTSNFLVSSQDRSPYLVRGGNAAYPEAYVPTQSTNFTITKANSLFNGFFTRAAVAEIDLWWNKFNISPSAGAGSQTYFDGTNYITTAPTYNGNQSGTFFGTNTFTVVVPSFAGAGGPTKTFTLPSGFYNVAQCLDAMIIELNQAAPAGFGAGYFELAPEPTGILLPDDIQTIATSGSQNFYFQSRLIQPSFNINLTHGGPAYPVRGLADMLSIPTYPGGLVVPAGTPGGNIPATVPTLQYPFYAITAPNLQAYPYIDFTSVQMTAVQDIKDVTTGQTNVDTLYRWVFADTTNPLGSPAGNGPNIGTDKYGYPILQGYTSFKLQRTIAFPKQIRMDPLLPVGQVNFTILDNNGNQIYVQPFEALEYNMLMLISEV